MAFKEGIMYAPHLRMLRQELGNPQRIVVLTLDADGQGSNAAEEQSGGVGIHVPTQRGAGGVDSLDQILAAGDDAADQV